MEMKKYLTPNMEVIKLSAQNNLLNVSGNGSGSTIEDETIQTGGSGRP